MPVPAHLRSVLRMPVPAHLRSVLRMPVPAHLRSVLRTPMPASLRSALALLAVLSLSPIAHAEAPAYLNFESGPVRPIALSPDGTRLYVTNLPDGRLEVFNVGAHGLTFRDAVPVGLEPVAVPRAAARCGW